MNNIYKRTCLLSICAEDAPQFSHSCTIKGTRVRKLQADSNRAEEV